MNSPYGNQGGFGQNLSGPGNYGQPQQGWSNPGNPNPNHGGYNPAGSQTGYNPAGSNSGGYGQGNFNPGGLAPGGYSQHGGFPPGGYYGQPGGAAGGYGAPGSYRAPEEPKNNNNNKLFAAIGGGILALVLVIGGVFFFTSGGFSAEERAKKEILSALQAGPATDKDGKIDYRKMNERLCKANQMSEEDIKMLEELAEQYGGNDSLTPTADASADPEKMKKLTTDNVTIDSNDPNKATVKEPNTGMSITMMKEDGKWVIC